MLRRAVFFICLAAAFPAPSAQSQSESAEAEFIVLRADRVTVWVSTGGTAHMNCSIMGLGDSAQMSCNSYSSSGAVPLVYHIALLVGSNQVGYIVSCGGGLLRRIGCQPLSVGQTLRGSVHGDKLSLIAGNKRKTYRVVISAYVGPLTTKSSGPDLGSSADAPPADGSSNAPSAEELGTKPSVKFAVEKSATSISGPGRQADQPNSVDKLAADAAAVVLFSSEPSGADIYVDGAFMGNTPSQIQLAAGTRTIRIEAKGHKPWSREVALTAGGKVTIDAVLEVGPKT